MVDFKIPNLCGASPELNDVLSKLADAKADAKAKLNEAASEATAAFAEAQNELAGLKDKLQSIEIPSLPKLNLQAEIASLASLVPGSPGFISGLASIKLEFESDIKSAGLELESLVTGAIGAISGGGDICALVPNLEKESGSIEAAVQKPIAPKQAAVAAVTESSSIVVQNAAVSAKVTELEVKKESYEVTNVPPTKDTGAYNVADKVKTISVDEKIEKVSTSGTSNNVAAPNTGFIHRRSAITELIKFADLQISGSEITFPKLKYKPNRINHIKFFPNAKFGNAMFNLGDTGVDGNEFRLREGFGDPVRGDGKGGFTGGSLDHQFFDMADYQSTLANWRAAGKPPYYDGREGLHMSDTVTDYGGSSFSYVGSISNDGTVTIKSGIIPEGNHPGNIASVKPISIFIRKGVPQVKRTKRPSFRDSVGARRSDGPVNRKYKGYAAVISYWYYETYDPNVKVSRDA